MLTGQSRYNYRVKIINPIRKKSIVVRELRHFHGRFNSITDMKVRLMEEFEECPTDNKIRCWLFSTIN